MGNGPARHRRGRWLAFVLAAVAISPLVLPVATAAAAQIAVSPDHAPPGESFQVTGSGFTPDFPPCRIYFDSADTSTQWDTCTITPNGTVNETVTVPSGTAPAQGSVRVCNFCGQGEFEENASALFTVDPAPTQSPTSEPTSDEPTSEPTETSSPSPSPASPSPDQTDTSPSPSATSEPSPTDSGPTPTESPTATAEPSPTVASGEPSPTASPTDSRVPISGGPMLLLPGDPEVADLPLGLPPAGLSEIPLPPPRCHPTGADTVIDFDDAPLGTAVTDRYVEKGVEFLPPSGAGTTLTARPPILGTMSVPMGLANLNRAEFGNEGNIAGLFVEAQTEVGVFVGINDVVDRDVTATLTARDGSGTTVGTATVTMRGGPQPVRYCLLVTQPEIPALSPPGTRIGELRPRGVARIASFTVEYDDHEADELIDRLFFTQALPPSPSAATRVEIDLIGPEGAVDISRRQSVWGTVRSNARVARVRVWNHNFYVNSFDGREYGDFDDYQDAIVVRDARDPSRYVFRVDDQVIRENTRGIYAMAFTDDDRRAQDDNDIEAFRSSPPPATGEGEDLTFDLTVAAVEVTQGVRGDPTRFMSGNQSRDDAAVHVIARPTVVRVYPAVRRTDGHSGPVSGFSARITAIRDGRTLGTIAPENPHLVTVEPGTALEDQRALLDGSLNFRLPEPWTYDIGTIDLTVEINPPGDAYRFECRRCRENNAVHLTDVEFSGFTKPMYVYPFAVPWQSEDGATMVAAPSYRDIYQGVTGAQMLLPIPRGWLTFRPLQLVDTWTGPTSDDDDRWLFKRVILDHTSGMRIDDPRWRGSMMGFFFADGADTGVGGKASLGLPIFESHLSPFTIAHEATHTYGISHASNAHGEADGGGWNPDYPGPCGEIPADEYGVDVFRTPLWVRTPADGAADEGDGCGFEHAHDYMSYGGWRWTTGYTWDLVADRLRAGRITAAAEDRIRALGQSASPDELDGQLLVVGTVGPGATAEVWATYDDPGGPDQEGSSPYRLELLDGDTVVTARGLPVYEQEETPGMLFMVRVPASGWDTLRILDGDTQLLREPRDEGSLAVELGTVPRSWPADGSVTVTWSLQGSSDETRVTLELSRDGGREWTTIAAGLGGGRADLAPEQVPASGEDVAVRARAVDGLRTAASEPVEVEVAPRLPAVAILEPAQDQVFPLGASVDLVGTASDFSQEEPLEASALTWSVDGTEVGSQSQWVALGLEEGEHEISLAAVGPSGATAETSITIRVVQDRDADGIADGWETDHGLSADDPGDGAGDRDGDELDERGEFAARTDPQAEDTDGDGFADGVEVLYGSDPTDAESGPLASHVHETLPARLARSSTDGSAPWPLLLGVGLAAIAATAAGWRRRHRSS